MLTILEVYSRPPHPPGALFVIMLTPGVFTNGRLVEEMTRLLQHGTLDDGIGSSRGSVRRSFGGASGASGVGSAQSLHRDIVPLFSTAVPFALYMDECPGDIWEMALFNIMFAKWPTTELMQAVAAKLAVARFIVDDAVGQSSVCCGWLPASLLRAARPLIGMAEEKAARIVPPADTPALSGQEASVSGAVVGAAVVEAAETVAAATAARPATSRIGRCEYKYGM